GATGRLVRRNRLTTIAGTRSAIAMVSVTGGRAGPLAISAQRPIATEPARAAQSAVSTAGSHSADRTWKPPAMSETTAIPIEASGVIHSNAPRSGGNARAAAPAT